MFQIDYNNVVKEEAKAEHEAMAELTTVKVLSGATLVATAPTAKRQSDNGYWLTGTHWEPIADHGLNYLQQELKVTGTAKNGKKFEQDMKLIGVSGDGRAKFK